MAPITTFSNALSEVTPTLRDVARWCDASYAAIRAYKLGDRRPPREVIARFAAELRKHADRMHHFADRLDRELKHGGDLIGGAPRKGGGR